MSQQRPEDNPSDGFQSIVREARIQMQQARSAFFYEQVSQGPVSVQTRQQLCAAARNYYDVLLEYRDADQAVEKAWQEESDVDLIGQLSARQTTVETPAQGDSNATRKETQNALLSMDPVRLINLTKDLDYFANQLGFGASVDSRRKKGRIGGAERYE